MDPKQLDVLIAASNRLAPILDSVNPDLTAFKRLGGKLIVYHGWIDQNIAPRNSIRYYEAVQDTMGGESQTQSFFRLFMVPGMGHVAAARGRARSMPSRRSRSGSRTGKRPPR